MTALLPYWRTRTQPIRTAAEITARIKIEPVQPLYLYQKLAQKATKLRLLGMSYPQIAKALNISIKTAKRASLRGGPQGRRSNPEIADKP